ncbi:hypothetical protein [Bacillus testis]|nr:hypothetical protein [Bacillus testis]
MHIRVETVLHEKERHKSCKSDEPVHTNGYEKTGAIGALLNVTAEND